MDPAHVIEILTATLDPVHQEAAGKKLDEVRQHYLWYKIALIYNNWCVKIPLTCFQQQSSIIISYET